MKLLDRYVAKAFAISLVVSFSFVLSLYLVVHFFGQLEDLEGAQKAFAARGIGLFAGVCRYYAITMPFIMTRLGPFAALLAAMWTIQKLARDQEIAAAQVSGVSLHRMVAPILVGGAILSLGLWAVRQQVLPRLAIEHQALQWLMHGRNETLIRGPLTIRDSARGSFSIQTYDPTAKIAHGVHYDGGDLSHAFDVPAMRYDDASRRWETVSDDAPPKPIPVDTDLLPRDIEIDARGLRFLGSDELDELARRLHGRPDLELMRQTRYTYPFATVVLLLLGLPLVLHRERQSIYAAWGLCLFLSVLYFAAENVLYGLAEREGLLSPVLAAWIPIAVFGTVGAMAFQDL